MVEVLATQEKGTPLLKRLAQKGRKGDDRVARLRPEQAELLRRLGGAGTKNPETGLPEYFLEGMNYGSTGATGPDPLRLTGTGAQSGTLTPTTSPSAASPFSAAAATQDQSILDSGGGPAGIGSAAAQQGFGDPLGGRMPSTTALASALDVNPTALGVGRAALGAIAPSPIGAMLGGISAVSNVANTAMNTQMLADLGISPTLGSTLAGLVGFSGLAGTPTSALNQAYASMYPGVAAYSAAHPSFSGPTAPADLPGDPVSTAPMEAVTQVDLPAPTMETMASPDPGIEAEVDSGAGAGMGASSGDVAGGASGTETGATGTLKDGGRVGRPLRRLLRRPMPRSGIVAGSGTGRADDVPMRAGKGGYVIPADAVAAAGDGNSNAGAQKIGERLGLPQGAAPAQSGGDANVRVSGGEFLINDPKIVTQLGGGNLDRGYKMLDDFVKSQRARMIRKLQSAKAPKGSYDG